jgi:hypothetical protein
MTFSPEANNTFTTFLRAWTSREDLRHTDASLLEIVDATVAIDDARRALPLPERYPLAA